MIFYPSYNFQFTHPITIVSLPRGKLKIIRLTVRGKLKIVSLAEVRKRGKLKIVSFAEVN